MRMYLDAKESVVGCKVFFNGVTGYEIGEGGDKHTVCLDSKICTCRAWELTGIPCMHVVSSIYYCMVRRVYPNFDTCQTIHVSPTHYLTMISQSLKKLSKGQISVEEAKA